MLIVQKRGSSLTCDFSRVRVKNIVALGISCFWLSLVSSVGWGEDFNKIRIGLPSPSISMLPFYIGKEKGLFQRAGLDVELIQIPTSIAVQAIMNGNLHFHTTPQAGLTAAASGLPLVVVLTLYKDAPWVLVTRKEVNKPADLIGKKVAISGTRTPPYYFARAGLEKMGLDEKQVSFIITGGSASSFAALTSNQVAGAVLSPPFDEKAVSLGYKKFLFLGDLVSIPYSGLFTSQAEIKNQRERVKRTIAASLEAAKWEVSHRAEAVEMIKEKFKVGQTEAEQSLDTMIRMLSQDGSISPEKVRGYLDILRQERPIPVDLDPRRLTDFSMLPVNR